MGPPLNTKMTRVLFLTFSPDGTQFAAASSNGYVCLFDADSHRLLASYSKDCINNLSPIVFSSDGKQLMTVSIEGTSHAWDAPTGQNFSTSQASQTSLLDSSGSALRGADEKPNLQFFPVDKAEFGYWAYIEGSFIWRDRTGLISVMDMSDIEQKWKSSLGEQIM
jgi:WD40 repeat protein